MLLKIKKADKQKRCVKPGIAFPGVAQCLSVSILLEGYRGGSVLTSLRVRMMVALRLEQSRSAVVVDDVCGLVSISPEGRRTIAQNYFFVFFSGLGHFLFDLVQFLLSKHLCAETFIFLDICLLVHSAPCCVCNKYCPQKFLSQIVDKIVYLNNSIYCKAPFEYSSK